MTKPTTITSILKIKGAVIFDDYVADKDVPKYGHHSLIYGFNGSGKTTVSRIFASLGTGVLQEKLPGGTSFAIALSNDTEISNAKGLGELKDRVMVYNEDFKTKNFRWAEGGAEPVFYIGAEQTELSVELEAKLKEREAQTPVVAQAKSAFSTAEKSLSKFKTDTARVISKAILWERGYTAPKLVADYCKQEYDASLILSDDEVNQLTEVTKQTEPHPRLPSVDTSRLDLSGHLSRITDLLQTTTGSATVDFLKDHERMSSWIKQGYEYHTSHDLTDCLLCGNELTKERLELILNKVIDDKLKQLESDLHQAQESHDTLLAHRLDLIGGFPSKHEIAKQLTAQFPEKTNGVRELLGQAEEYFVVIAKVLNEKSSTPNTAVGADALPSLDDIKQWERKLELASAAYNELITEHNQIHDQFNDRQKTAKDAVKRHYLAKHQPEYAELTTTNENAETAIKAAQDAYTVIDKRISEIRQSIRRHGPAAEIITALIANFLGHQEITVEADDEHGYRLKRSGNTALGILSEGEKTAITLCYFLTLLEAEGRSLKDLIIVLDDPISSLDTKSLNYAINLLRAQLVKAAQLIILTHNLQFMNEVKKWIKNRKEYREATPPLLFIDTKLDPITKTRRSTLVKMSKLMREYESEYHYLFSLILQTSKQGVHECEYVYLMPNAMRKVLEIFLSFKVPGGGGITNQIKSAIVQNCGIDKDRLSALTRLSEVESHGDNLDDLTSFSSMTVEETHDACCALLEMIEKVDGDHHKQICKICK